MLILYPGEKFLPVEIDSRLKKKYAISNYGRLVSYEGENYLNGVVVKGSCVNGFRLFRYKVNEDDKIKNKHKFFYKLVAEKFLPIPNEEDNHLIHLDYNLSNDHYSNLKWVSSEVAKEFQNKNPKVVQARRELVERMKTREGKLSSTQVMRLKKMLLDPNRKTRIRILAKQFGVSEMQLYRIKSGENWSRIEVNDFNNNPIKKS